MLFNSFAFVLFFPIVTLSYFLTPPGWRWALLLVASSISYMWFVPKYILILLFTIGVDYAAGRLIEESQGQRRQAWLVASVVANLSVLAVFKYGSFFLSNLSWLSTRLGLSLAIPHLELILPIGLSFHTFQAMAYTIEVYRGNVPAERHLGYYALYVMFYPQLLAGPIERPQGLLPQLRAEHRFEYSRAVSGMVRMAIGLFKKMVVADQLAVTVDAVYSNPTTHQGLALLVPTLFFTVQLYCDFSGYSDVALGAAEVMGIELTRNFRSPLTARTLSELWQRWHISLTSWFRDYVYFPLMGSRLSKPKLLLVVMIVFTLSGLWHGARWTCVLFGAFSGVMVVLGELMRPVRRRLLRQKGGRLISLATTFLLFSTSLVFFRARSLSDVRHIASHLHVGLLRDVSGLASGGTVLGLSGLSLAAIAVSLVAFLRLESLDVDTDLVVRLARCPRPARWFVYFGLVYSCLAVASLGLNQRFIYFQF